MTRSDARADGRSRTGARRSPTPRTHSRCRTSSTGDFTVDWKQNQTEVTEIDRRGRVADRRSTARSAPRPRQRSARSTALAGDPDVAMALGDRPDRRHVGVRPRHPDLGDADRAHPRRSRRGDGRGVGSGTRASMVGRGRPRRATSPRTVRTGRSSVSTVDDLADAQVCITHSHGLGPTRASPTGSCACSNGPVDRAVSATSGSTCSSPKARWTWPSTPSAWRRTTSRPSSRSSRPPAARFTDRHGVRDPRARHGDQHRTGSSTRRSSRLLAERDVPSVSDIIVDRIGCSVRCSHVELTPRPFARRRLRSSRRPITQVSGSDVVGAGAVGVEHVGSAGLDDAHRRATAMRHGDFYSRYSNPTVAIVRGGDRRAGGRRGRRWRSRPAWGPSRRPCSHCVPPAATSSPSVSSMPARSPSSRGRAGGCGIDVTFVDVATPGAFAEAVESRPDDAGRSPSRRRTPSSSSPTSTNSDRSRVRSRWSTRRSPRRSASSRWRSASTSHCTRRRRESPATTMPRSGSSPASGDLLDEIWAYCGAARRHAVAVRCAERACAVSARSASAPASRTRPRVRSP